MPTKKAIKVTKKPKVVKPKVVKDPTKFVLTISKCGNNIVSNKYKSVENSNPVLLALNGVCMMSDGLVPKDSNPVFKYLLACAILKGLEFDKLRLSEDIKEIADRIKSLSLSELSGGIK